MAKIGVGRRRFFAPRLRALQNIALQNLNQLHQKNLLMREFHLPDFRDCPYDKGKVAIERAIKHVTHVASTV